jgi:ribonuclease-3
MGDAFEAVLGALYIDQGYDAVYSYFAPILEDELNHILDENRDRDAKSQFQEWSQSNLSVTPRYRLASTEGPDHAKVFTVQVWIGDVVAAVGTGSSKQVAEQQAARSALAALIAQRQQAGQQAPAETSRGAGDETREAAPPAARNL